MQANSTCRPSLRLVASSGIAASGNAPAALKSTTLQRDLALEAISLSLAYAASTIAVLLACMDLALKLSAVCTALQGIPNTGSSSGSTKT
jgi:hypothetical protein